jgi:hypothetical protein
MPTRPNDIPHLLTFWDFQEPAGQLRIAQGRYPYALHEMAGPVERVEGGLFGPWAAELKYQQWFCVPRKEAPGLSVPQVSVVAWVKRGRKPETECEAVAGIWNETNKLRQYCLFLDLRIHDSADQVCGHVSATGGPTEGHRWCMDSAIGTTTVPWNEDQWRCIGFTYDGVYARAYLDGRLDLREKFNPYYYPGGLFDGGENGADFTVAAVHRGERMGNWFTGQMAGLAVFDAALDEDTMQELARWCPTSNTPKDSGTR